MVFRYPDLLLVVFVLSAVEIFKATTPADLFPGLLLLESPRTAAMAGFRVLAIRRIISCTPFSRVPKDGHCFGNEYLESTPMFVAANILKNLKASFCFATLRSRSVTSNHQPPRSSVIHR